MRICTDLRLDHKPFKYKHHKSKSLFCVLSYLPSTLYIISINYISVFHDITMCTTSYACAPKKSGI